FCGITGLKPTYGRVSRYGALPLSWSLDHMGPLTRTVRDAAVALNVIAGRDPRDPTSSRRPAIDFVPDAECSIRGLRIGFPADFYLGNLDRHGEASVRGAGARAGALGATGLPGPLPRLEAVSRVARAIRAGWAAAAG